MLKPNARQTAEVVTGIQRKKEEVSANSINKTPSTPMQTRKLIEKEPPLNAP